MRLPSGRTKDTLLNSTVGAELAISEGSDIVGLRREPGNSNAAVAFVADVKADHQSCHLLDDTGVFQLASIDSADAGNLTREVANLFGGVLVVAANDDIAIDRIPGLEKLRRDIMKRRNYPNAFGHDLGCLLRG